jgi:H+/Cl- antiporter ClcA
MIIAKFLSFPFLKTHPILLRNVILAGAAAGVAYNFNTPLTGLLFALEISSRTIAHHGNKLLLRVSFCPRFLCSSSSLIDRRHLLGKITFPTSHSEF